MLETLDGFSVAWLQGECRKIKRNDAMRPFPRRLKLKSWRPLDRGGAGIDVEDISPCFNYGHFARTADVMCIDWAHCRAAKKGTLFFLIEAHDVFSNHP